MNKRKATSSHQMRFLSNRGFTLVEVLVALVVLSIGLLGLAGLQSRGLQFNQGAVMRTHATQLIYDLSDRMRANINAFETGAYLGTGTGTATASCHTTSGCSPAQMAADDLAKWNQAVAQILPMGAAVICRDATPNDGNAPGTPDCDGNATSPIAIKLWWDDDRDGVLDPTPFALAFQP
jgi:type IV pilus assembly protein PilV